MRYVYISIHKDTTLLIRLYAQMPKKCVPRPFLTSWSPLRVVQHSKSYPFATASLRKPLPESPNFSKSLTAKQNL